MASAQSTEVAAAALRRLGRERTTLLRWADHRPDFATRLAPVLCRYLGNLGHSTEALALRTRVLAVLETRWSEG